jgi:hypothetical protein
MVYRAGGPESGRARVLAIRRFRSWASLAIEGQIMSLNTQHLRGARGRAPSRIRGRHERTGVWPHHHLQQEKALAFRVGELWSYTP